MHASLHIKSSVILSGAAFFSGEKNLLFTAAVWKMLVLQNSPRRPQ
jgi:hypothetical protein